MKYEALKGTDSFRLNNTNYINRVYRVSGYLKAQDLKEIVVGPDPESQKPEFFRLNEKKGEVYRRWIEKDRKAWHDIVSLCREEDGMFYRLKTAKEL